MRPLPLLHAAWEHPKASTNNLPASSRDHRLDSAKGVLILLVVLGHLVESGLDGWKRPVPGALLTWLYLFHMPAFVFLAGMTARREQLGRRLLTLGVLMVFFQAAYAVPLTLRDGQYPQSPWQPYWILWFLLSLCCWMALLPLIRRLPPKMALAGAVALCLASGWVPGVGYPLGLSRTLVFLPWFVAGHLYGKALFAALPRSAWVKGAGALLTVALAVLLYQRFGSLHRWLYGSNNYANIPSPALWAPALRLALLGGAALGMVSFFALMPRREGWLSKVGSASLAVFLLHGFAVVFAGQHFRAAVQGRCAALELLAAFAGALLLTWLLGRPVLDRALRSVAAWVVERLLPRAPLAAWPSAPPPSPSTPNPELPGGSDR